MRRTFILAIGRVPKSFMKNLTGFYAFINSLKQIFDLNICLLYFYSHEQINSRQDSYLCENRR